jgi:hypothetical protein
MRPNHIDETALIDLSIARIISRDKRWGEGIWRQRFDPHTVMHYHYEVGRLRVVFALKSIMSS